MKPELDFNIEQLVLYGFSVRDSRRIRRAVEFELSRLFTERGVPDSFSAETHIPRLDFGSVTLRSNAHTHTLASQIAHSIYTGLDTNPASKKENN